MSFVFYFQTPYEALVNEDTEIGSEIFRYIIVEDVDLTGDTLEVFCKDYEKVCGLYSSMGLCRVAP